MVERLLKDDQKILLAIKIAVNLGNQKKENYRNQLNQLFSSQLNSLSTYEFSNLISSFMSGNAQPLATVLAKKERAEAEKQICQSFSDQSKSDVIAALNNSTAAISRMAKKITDEQFSQYKEQVETEVSKVEKVVPEEKRQIRSDQDKLKQVETSFKELRFGEEEQEIDLEKQCLWVLSAIRKNPDSALASRIVYGGVHAEPRITQLPPGSSGHQNLINSITGGGNNPVDSGKVINAGRAGKQARLRELAEFDKLGGADHGWLKQEINAIAQGRANRSIRVPHGKVLAHERGREAAKGYSYKHANLQNIADHKNQHKYDNQGRKNQERPI